MVPNEAAAAKLQAGLERCGTQILLGEAGLCMAAGDPAVDTVVAAIVGALGCGLHHGGR